MTRNLTLLAATTVFAALFGGVAHASIPTTPIPPAAVDALAISETPVPPAQLALAGRLTSQLDISNGVSP